MGRLLRNWARVRSLVRRRQGADDLRSEIDSHLEEAAEEYRQQGLSPAEARRAACRSFGGVTQVEEAYREELSFAWIDHCLRETRHAIRSLRRSAGFSVAVLLVLAMSIGAVTAIFVLLNSIVLRPLPFPQPERLVVLTHTASDQNRPGGVSDGLYFHYLDHARSFESIGTYGETVRNLRVGDRTERVRVADVSATLFQVLGVKPALGRLFTAEDGRPGFMSLRWQIPILLSHDFWVDRFGADPNIVGRVITLPDSPREVIGVMPAGFSFPNPNTQIWMLLEPMRSTRASMSDLDLNAVGRLRADVTPASAQAELAHLQPQMRPVVTLLKTAVVGDAAPMIWILFAGMTLLLLIACANAANFFVVRAEQRHREVAVRQALGAQAGQIARLFFIESLVLTTLAATVGIAIARGLVFGVIALVPVALPRMTEISIDAVPVVFAGGLALLMAIFYAVLSGRHHQRTAVSRRVIRDPLLVVQVALALTLLTASALMVKTYLNLSKTDLGFTPDRVLAVEIGLPGSKARQHVQIYQRVVERIRNVPGVESASAASFAPLSGQEHRFPIEAGSSPIAFKFFTPGYFQTMGTTILEGRSFATTDQVSLPYPVLVSAALARRLQADRNVIGTTLRRLSEDGSIPDVSGPVPPFTIAGIVDDVREISLRDGPAAIVYVPLIEPPVELQLVPTNMTLLLRTHVPPLRLVDAVKDAVAASEPALSVGRIGTMDAIVNASRSKETFVGALLLLAAAMALLLGVVGIYGSVAQVVRRRLREISIRLALGARRWDVIWMVAAGALRAIVVGATFGLMVVFAATQMLTALLFGVAPRDPISIFLVIALVMVSGGLAAFAAARHAVRLAPLVVIRGEE